MALSSVPEIIDDIREGKMVILMDDEDRENEGDVIIAAEAATPEIITFFAAEACGLICMPIMPERAKQLQLPLMVRDNRSQHETNFTVSIDAADRKGPGISSIQRAHTAKQAMAKNAKPSDIVQPGHIFPLVAKPGGVLRRAGHTEAGVDLARMAGFEPAGVSSRPRNGQRRTARSSAAVMSSDCESSASRTSCSLSSATRRAVPLTRAATRSAAQRRRAMRPKMMACIAMRKLLIASYFFRAMYPR